MSASLCQACTELREAVSADLVLALCLGEEGRAVVLAPNMHKDLRAFRLMLPQDLLAPEVRSTAELPLPTALIYKMGAGPQSYLWLPVTLPDHPASGILVLWLQNKAASELPPVWQILSKTLSCMMKEAEENQLQNEFRGQFDDLFESVPAGILLINGSGKQAMVNERAAQLLGCRSGAQPSGEVQQRMLALRQSCDNTDRLEALYAQNLSNAHFSLSAQWHIGAQIWKVETRPVRGDGSAGRIWLFSDVTAEVLMAEDLRRLAALDPLTGMPNRRHFEERALQIVAAREVDGYDVGLLMIDVDHFKRVNDRFGHAVGDIVLKTVAARCHAALRNRDLFARLGGEEFAALISLAPQDDIVSYGEALRLAIEQHPILAEGHEIFVTISIGATTGQGNISGLLNTADHALYAAKAAGRNCVKVWKADG